MLVRALNFATRVKTRPKPPVAERQKISPWPVGAPGSGQPAVWRSFPPRRQRRGERRRLIRRRERAAYPQLWFFPSD